MVGGRYSGGDDEDGDDDDEGDDDDVVSAGEVHEAPGREFRSGVGPAQTSPHQETPAQPREYEVHTHTPAHPYLRRHKHTPSHTLKCWMR